MGVENTAGLGLRPIDVCLLFIGASGVVCGLLTAPLFKKRNDKILFSFFFSLLN